MKMQNRNTQLKENTIMIIFLIVLSILIILSLRVLVFSNNGALKIISACFLISVSCFSIAIFFNENTGKADKVGDTTKDIKYTHKKVDLPSHTVKCSKCGSVSITTIKEGYNAGKGILGLALFGPLGLMSGASTKDTFINVCQSCGHKWKLPKK